MVAELMCVSCVTVAQQEGPFLVCQLYFFAFCLDVIISSEILVAGKRLQLKIQNILSTV